MTTQTADLQQNRNRRLSEALLRVQRERLVLTVAFMALRGEDVVAVPAIEKLLLRVMRLQRARNAVSPLARDAVRPAAIPTTT